VKCWEEAAERDSRREQCGFGKLKRKQRHQEDIFWQDPGIPVYYRGNKSPNWHILAIRWM